MRTDEAGAKLTAMARLRRIYELPTSLQRTPGFDGIRGIAILLVFFVHDHTLFGRFLSDAPVSQVISRFLGHVGHAGVDLFFVLSGMLIYGMLIRKPIRFHRFMWRRLQRLYPAFFVVLVTYLILGMIFPEQGRVPPGRLQAVWYVLANAIFLPGVTNIQPIITVAWSLSYEFTLYVVAPLIVSGLLMRRWRAIWRVLFLTTFATVYLTSFAFRPLTHVRMMMFVSGMILHEALSSPRFRQALSRAGEYLVTALLLATLPAIYFMMRAPEEAGPDAIAWSSPVVCLLFISCFWFGAYAGGFQGWLAAFCSTTPLRWLGNISYSFYLWHGLTLKAFALALQLTVPDFAQGVVMFWVALPLTLLGATVVSTVLFVLIEKPFLVRRTVGSLSDGADIETAVVFRGSAGRVATGS